MATLAPERGAKPRSAERIFIWIFAVAALAMIFGGFFPSWFGRAFVDNPPGLPLTPLVWVHGLVFTAYIVLFLAQISFIAANQRALHAKLGRTATVFAALLFVVGIVAGLNGAVRGAGPPSIPADVFLLLPLANAFALGWLVWQGYRHRFSAHVHKRMMLFSIVVMVGPGSGRMWALFGTFAVPVLMALAVWAFDLATRRKLERGVIVGGLVAMASYIIPFTLGGTEAWRGIANALIDGWTVLIA